MEHSQNSEEIIKRCSVLEHLYHELLVKLELNEREPSIVQLNQGVLFSTVANYFSDIQQLKFHSLDDDIVQSRKRAAYMCFWIAKMKPIQIIASDENKATQFINEIFALAVFFASLEVDTGFLPNYLYRDFVYHLHFKTFSPESLDLIAGFVELSASNQGTEF